MCILGANYPFHICLLPSALTIRTLPLPYICSVRIILMTTIQTFHIIKPLVVVSARYISFTVVYLIISVNKSSFCAVQLCILQNHRTLLLRQLSNMNQLFFHCVLSAISVISSPLYVKHDDPAIL